MALRSVVFIPLNVSVVVCTVNSTLWPRLSAFSPVFPPGSIELFGQGSSSECGPGFLWPNPNPVALSGSALLCSVQL